MWDLSSPTQDWPCTPRIGRWSFTPGPPERSHDSSFNNVLKATSLATPKYNYLAHGLFWATGDFLHRWRICLQCRRPWFDSWVRKIHWGRDRLSILVFLGCPCGSAGKEPTCNAGDLSSIPGLGRSPGEGNGYPLQYFALEVPWTDEPGGLQSMGSQRVRRDWATHIHTHTQVQGNPKIT